MYDYSSMLLSHDDLEVTIRIRKPDKTLSYSMSVIVSLESSSEFYDHGVILLMCVRASNRHTLSSQSNHTCYINFMTKLLQRK